MFISIFIRMDPNEILLYEWRSWRLPFCFYNALMILKHHFSRCVFAYKLPSLNWEHSLVHIYKLMPLTESIYIYTYSLIHTCILMLYSEYTYIHDSCYLVIEHGHHTTSHKDSGATNGYILNPTNDVQLFSPHPAAVTSHIKYVFWQYCCDSL